MNFSEEELQEFFAEAMELLEVAEKKILALDTGSDFRSCFDSIFRSLHNLKGAASMMELEKLQAHVHELETLLMTFKEANEMPKAYTGFFLKGVDAAREILNGKDIVFDYTVTDAASEEPPVAPETSIEIKSSTPSFSQETLNEFMTEAEEILERLEASFRIFEEGKQAPETIHDVYRDIHSFKGAAFLFGFNDLGEMAHAMESCLEPLRTNGQVPEKIFISEVFKCLSLLESAIESKHTQPDFTVDATTVNNAIRSLHQNAKLAASIPTLVAVKDTAVVSVPTEDSAPADSNASIRVPVALLDNLMTLMGEMVLVRNQVLQFSSQSEDLNFLNLSQRLNVVTSEIQEEMMKTRMQPIGNIINKFYRVTRDLSLELKKNIQLHVTGAETELDKSLLEAIKDPLTHIIRNSCDHGIEMPAHRRQNGKPEQGNIHINAYHEGGQIVIEIRDDGKGLNKEALCKKALEKGLFTESQIASMSEKDILNIIFAPGFSTASAVTNLSGRGVGMDVVRTNIEKIGGTVDLSSSMGMGTQILLKIPLTLAIVPALIVEGGNSTYAIPQVKLLELVRVDSSSETQIEFLQDTPVYRLRGEILPLVYLSQVLGTSKTYSNSSEITNIAVVHAENFCFGLIVDAIKDTADIVVKPIHRLLKSLHAYSGATILGDGSVALILDPTGLAKLSKMQMDMVRKQEKSVHAVNEKSLENQEFLIVNLNSPTKHAILLNYVHRLEEFEAKDVEFSGKERVVRYRNSILPIISANSILGYEEHQTPKSSLNVVVIERAGRLFGIEVSDIVDTLSTQIEMHADHTQRTGIMGNLSTPEELIVILDPIEMITAAYPHLTDKPKVPAQSSHFDPSNKSFQILLVEDTPFFRKHVKKILEAQGHMVESAADGKEALDMLERIETDLIISDIEMPTMNGFQFAKAVRNHPKLKHLPIMALSSRYDSSYRNKGVEAGFDRYLEKIDAQVLLATIQELTQSKRKSA